MSTIKLIENLKERFSSLEKQKYGFTSEHEVKYHEGQIDLLEEILDFNEQEHVNDAVLSLANCCEFIAKDNLFLAGCEFAGACEHMLFVKEQNIVARFHKLAAAIQNIIDNKKQ